MTVLGELLGCDLAARLTPVEGPARGLPRAAYRNPAVLEREWAAES